MTQFTPFQILCERQAIELLQSYGRQLENRRVGQVLGFVEPYISICGRISGTEVTIYIYEEGVEFTNHHVDVRFESPDYGSDEKLVEAFIEQLSKYLDRKAAEDVGEILESEDTSWPGELARKLWGFFFARR